MTQITDIDIMMIDTYDRYDTEELLAIEGLEYLLTAELRIRYNEITFGYANISTYREYIDINEYLIKFNIRLRLIWYNDTTKTDRVYLILNL